MYKGLITNEAAVVLYTKPVLYITTRDLYPRTPTEQHDPTVSQALNLLE